MYFNIDGRDEVYQAELRMFIESAYKIDIISMREHNRGWYGETWKLNCADGQKYFVKIIYFEKQAKIYQKCFPILQHMKNHGIDFVSQFIPTKDGKPYLIVKGGTLALFKFIDGKHIDETITPPTVFVPNMVKIYNIKRPEQIEIETFDMEVFDYLEKQMEQLRGDDEPYRLIKSNWELLVDIDNKRKHFAQICKRKKPKLFITSGDVGGNTLVDNGGKMYTIDWDWIILEPPERDFFWYVRHPKQIDQISKALIQNGFERGLDMDILAYYTYFSYIYFLSEAVDCLLFNPISRKEAMQRLHEHLDKNWCLRQGIAGLEMLQKGK